MYMKNKYIIALVIVLVAVLVSLSLESKKNQDSGEQTILVKDKEEPVPTETIDEGEIFKGLKDFQKRADIQAQQELLAKEQFLTEKRIELINDYEQDLNLVEAELEKIREDKMGFGEAPSLIE